MIRQVDLELFGGCNYKCQMCPQGTDVGREKEFKKKLPFHVFKKIVDESIELGAEAFSLHGSGEPTLNSDIYKCIEYIKSKNKKCVSFTNGYTLTKKVAQNLINSGLDILRVSVIGYNKETYFNWMRTDAFERVRDNCARFTQLSNSTEIHSYHLILDNQNVDYEIEQYKRNWVDITGTQSEIWLMHNWSGLYDDVPYDRKTSERIRKTCQRPFKPVLQVRAGGLNGKHGAVVPCCMVLGQDGKAVLGHIEDETLSDIWNGDAYTDLRLKHTEKRFDEIDYCKNCDQLYEVPESLVWTNIEGRVYGQSKMLNDLNITHEVGFDISKLSK